ncbi:FecR family protein [Sinomicrobium pectinilyticum]|uniref:FecR family protein n=1 Tax=Sinomicrobium pectinilyticum TaxID=1084421 RepID=A0A3N0EIU5_SINP1|nr:FecR family protein [Sinomicrobium pectinilyticum]RNL87751.1 FecR family protein [Sinomicrobium pectinilyticum]
MTYKDYSSEDFAKDHYFQKWVLEKDTITANFWDNWLAQHPEKKEVVETARDMVRLLARDEDDPTPYEKDRIWMEIIEKRNIREKSRMNSPKSIFGKTGKRYLKVAAVIIPLVALAYGAYQLDFLGSKGSMTLDPNRITLELQDGTIKVMDEEASGLITTGDGKALGKQDKNILTYQRSKDDVTEELVYNELTVPYGKNFELVLSDGSHIYLNAGSKLRYPVQFPQGKPRNVFLDGEAFFDVARDSTRSQFTVVTDMLNTQVYGTRFNVSSYKDENNTFTVLEEGSVGVYQPNSPKKEDPVKIVPGQRAVFEDGSIQVETVDIRKYTSWIDGELYFLDDRFELILKELERRFDVKIDNRYEKLNDVKFTGSFTREPLDQILKLFQYQTPFDYDMKKKTITIQKPQPMTK